MRPGSIREKSRSVFTSRSSRRRIAMRDLLPPLDLVGKARSVGQRLLERSDQQRQRRSEFVLDVREERRLGPIELRQRFRALPLLL